MNSTWLLETMEDALKDVETYGGATVLPLTITHIATAERFAIEGSLEASAREIGIACNLLLLTLFSMDVPEEVGHA